MNTHNKLIFLDHLSSKDNVLIAPLNWGLGHASRCVPIIKYLDDRRVPVVLASDGVALDLLRKEFPHLPYVQLNSYKIHYSKYFVLSMLWQSPKILFAIIKEYRITKNLVTQHKINYIISDNRYGIRHPKISSNIIIHQIQILLPNKMIQWGARLLNRMFINMFDQCWIPDLPQSILAGTLSHAKGIHNHTYIGPLTRLNPLNNVALDTHICIILSGPEPSRTTLELTLIRLLAQSKYSIILIRGTQESPLDSSDNIHTIDIADQHEINMAIHRSEIIITRSGYSTIMDIQKFDKKVIMIPTPGQTEQEYLAQRLKKPNYYLPQKDLDKTLHPLLKRLLT